MFSAIEKGSATNKTVSAQNRMLISKVDIAAGGRLPRVRFPIRMKITLPYVILALLLALGAAYVITQIVVDNLEKRFTNALIESGKLASEWMVREEGRLLETLRLMANAEGVPLAIQSRDAEKLRELTFGIAVDHQEEAIEFLDAQGFLFFSMRHNPGARIEEYTFAKDGDAIFLNWDFAKKVVEGNADAVGDKYAGFAPAGWGNYFYVAGPIYDEQGNFAGVVLVGKSLSTMISQIREETLAQVTLYNFNGQVIDSTFYDPVALDSSTVSTSLERQDDGSLSRGLKNMRGINVANIDYAEILGPWEVRDKADLGVIGISLAKTFVVTTTGPTQLKVFLLVFLALSLVIIMGTALANYITQPLLRLVHASTQVAKGDLQVQIEPKSGDEVAVLTESFNQMVASLNASKMDLLHAYDSTLEGWSKALELRDKETEGHTLRVTKMTVRLAEALGLQGDALVQIQRGALLHDIGKMGISDAILLKPGKLTDEEWEIMRKHPQYAYDMLSSIEYLRPALEIPYGHHEHWDGSGYPNQLKGEEIPISARIFSVVDVWDALRSERPYHEAMPEGEVLQYLQAKSGTLFDPHVVDVFLKNILSIQLEVPILRDG